jgi:hypothetical protein
VTADEVVEDPVQVRRRHLREVQDPAARLGLDKPTVLIQKAQRRDPAPRAVRSVLQDRRQDVLALTVAGQVDAGVGPQEGFGVTVRDLGAAKDREDAGSDFL